MGPLWAQLVLLTCTQVEPYLQAQFLIYFCGCFCMNFRIDLSHFVKHGVEGGQDGSVGDSSCFASLVDNEFDPLPMVEEEENQLPHLWGMCTTAHEHLPTQS